MSTDKMEIGYRIIRPEDIGSQPLSFAQISLWRTAAWGVSEGVRAVEEAISIAEECRRRGIRTVFHPLEYPLADERGEEAMAVLRRLAASADLGIIIHDEGGPGGSRLTETQAAAYEQRTREISLLCSLSIENAFNSSDCLWFWERFVARADADVSITGRRPPGIGGFDSVAFVRDLPEHLARRVNFVHMHHKGRSAGGHGPLAARARLPGSKRSPPFARGRRVSGSSWSSTRRRRGSGGALSSCAGSSDVGMVYLNHS
jgi:hypothetical protein